MQPPPHQYGQPAPGQPPHGQPGPYAQNPYGQPSPHAHPGQYPPAVYAGYVPMPHNPAHSGIKWLLFSFEGRIRRSSYWAGSLGAGFALYALVFVFAGIAAATGVDALAALSFLPLIALVWTSLALQVKRWHDRGKPGVCVLISLIPIVGPIWSFIELGCLPGTMGPNTYGPDPKM